MRCLPAFGILELDCLSGREVSVVRDACFRCAAWSFSARCFATQAVAAVGTGDPRPVTKHKSGSSSVKSLVVWRCVVARMMVQPLLCRAR